MEQRWDSILPRPFKTLKSYRSDKGAEMPYLGVRYYEKKAQNGSRQFFISNVNDTYKIHFEDASSGIQTMTPLAVIL